MQTDIFEDKNTVEQNVSKLMNTPEQIIRTAINEYSPSHIICLFSGGYDSMVLAHYVHSCMTFDVPLLTYAIDAQLSADGWREWVDGVANDYGWHFDIYHNTHGFNQYLEMIEKTGQPRTRRGHTYAYWRLKERGIDAMKRDHKTHRTDRILFLSGIRKAESRERDKKSDEIHRIDSAVFANPLLYWSDDDVLAYRIENELPTNPFYETVGGSGDCQCNWGRFITFRKLQKFSPKLAAGAVALIDRLSRENHGYGWDGSLDGQSEAFHDFEDSGKMTTPFLCANCSRAKTPKPGMHQAQEERYLQVGLW